MRLPLVLAAVLLAAGCSNTQLMPAAEAPPVNGEVVKTVADPVSISIPKLGVTDDVVPVAYAPDGGMELPDVVETGWFEKGPRPGEPDRALIAGHVDWNGTPGAFKHLGRLAKGDAVTVKDKAGEEHTFIVYAVRAGLKKTDYVTETAPLVFRATTERELALVTCSGPVVGKSYLDNTVVLARLLT